MSESDEMDVVMARQKELLAAINRTFINFKKSPKGRISENYIRVREELVKSYFNEFRQNHSKMSHDENYDKDIYETCEEVYLDCLTSFQDSLQGMNKSEELHAMPSGRNGGKTETGVKLPKIDLPSFDGDYTKWTSFSDMFRALIDQNKKLTDVEKLYYLKRSLTGQAVSLIMHTEINECNYKVAWETLEKRYNNRRFIINNLLKRLTSVKALREESHKGLRDLIDITTEALKALEVQSIEVDKWDVIVVHITVEKLDFKTREQWELIMSQKPHSELPTFKELREFLENRFRMLENMITSKKVVTTKSSSFLVQGGEISACPYCNEEHPLPLCQEFNKEDYITRHTFIKNNRLCYNCFGKHRIVKCRNRNRCTICQKFHHTLIHPPDTKEKEHDQEENKTTAPVESLTSTSLMTRGGQIQTILATLLVTARGRNEGIIRSLLDQGSEASFITENAVQLLGLYRKPVRGMVSGLGGESKQRCKYSVTLTISSIHSNFHLEIEAYVLKTITTNIPAKETNHVDWSQYGIKKLADPEYHKPRRVELLLGADVYAEIVQDGLIKISDGKMIAQKTYFGWIISGVAQINQKQNNDARCFKTMVELAEDCNEQLKKFWEIESEPRERTYNIEEQQCNDIYISTVKRREDGRYIVKLPVRNENWRGNSKEIAMKRYISLEKRLYNNSKLEKDYRNVLDEYQKKNYAELIPNVEREDDKLFTHYLPHHAVCMEDKLTSKCRVVFDGSCKNKEGKSLNDNLMTGPILQRPLTDLLLRWRKHKYVMVADIEKMYLQILVQPKDADLQRIFWRPSRDSAIEEYRLLTVTFGTSCAPYLAVRTLIQLADDECENFPNAAKLLKSDFYMDDLMTGCNDEKTAVLLYKELRALLKRGCFNLKKWNTNSSHLLNYIEENSEEQLEVIPENVSRVLGITWNRLSDEFEYKVRLGAINSPLTKRIILSEISRIFDPLGWLTPIVISAKIFIQRLWLTGLSWDDVLPVEIADKWISYREDLREVKGIKIPRWVLTSTGYKTELHGFADASMSAYAAVVYLRTRDEEGNIQVSLLLAKSKVAPIKQISVPRLELCAAVLLARLLANVAQVLEIPKEQIFAWTDSTIALAWLRDLPNKWTVFVANRVAEVHNLLDNTQWNHVTSQENPADCGSRGMKAIDLPQHELWWRGPNWLRHDLIIRRSPEDLHTALEMNPKYVNSFIVQEEECIIDRFSSLLRLCRVVAYCRRFKRDRGDGNKRTIYLTKEEIEQALMSCIKVCQGNCFYEELKDLQGTGRVKKTSKISKLHPFVDHFGILRVGGRLQHAPFDDDVCCPVILPNKHQLTKLIIGEAHITTMHGGIQLTLNHLRVKYWIVSARNNVKNYLRNCVKCIRFKADTQTQLMGELPPARVTPSRPFCKTGVDYAGPITLRVSKGRGCKAYKGYICLFVCMVTRAIHLEAVSDMTTSGFLAAFKRFTSRRGLCSDLWSDNGTNFRGASRELVNIIKNNQSEIGEQLATKGVRWHFICPNAPHFGGLWEAGVKSTKYHLRRVIGESTLTYEELSTVLCQVEACLNSRPLTQLTDDLEDPRPLTPSHFLIGESTLLVPERNYKDVNINLLTRYQLVQRMVQDFWKRWSLEYLHTLTQRQKWKTRVREVNVGDVVLIKEEGLPPARWLMGVVLNKIPGPDGLTRVVTVKNKNTQFTRPIVKLIPLINDQ